jgi:uncharacterized membrane protein
MLDIIFAIKFVHELAAAAMFGTWLAIAVFMVLAGRTGNTSVVALTAQFAVKVELTVMIPALAVPAISGFPLGSVVGLSAADDFWVELSIAIYAAVVLAWLIALRLEFRIRNVSQEAALSAKPLPEAWRRLFRIWSMLAVLILAGMVGLFLLMVWQPHLN